MNYFITKDAEGNIGITSPVPPNTHLLNDESLIVDVLPSKKDTEKYQLLNGKLTVINKSLSDLSTDESNKLNFDFKQIDQETNDTIKSGFMFNGLAFSLSLNAQLNWQSLFMLKQAGLYTDTIISTIDSDVFVLLSSEVNNFFVAYTNALKSKLKVGRDKKQILKIPIKK